MTPRATIELFAGARWDAAEDMASTHLYRGATGTAYNAVDKPNERHTVVRNVVTLPSRIHTGHSVYNTVPCCHTVCKSTAELPSIS